MHTYIHIHTRYINKFSRSVPFKVYISGCMNSYFNAHTTYIHTYIPNYLPNPHITHQVTWSWSRYCCHRWSLRLRHCMAPARTYRHTFQLIVWENNGHLNISGRQRRTCHGNLSWKLTWTALFQWCKKPRTKERLTMWTQFLYSYLEWMKNDECVSTGTKILMWNICSMYVYMHAYMYWSLYTACVAQSRNCKKVSAIYQNCPSD